MSDRGPGGVGPAGDSLLDRDGWLEGELRTVLHEETAALRLDVTAPELRRRILVEDRLRRRSEIALTALVAVLAVALAVPIVQSVLGPFVGPAQPTAAPVASPAPTPAGGHEPGWMGGARTAVVVRWDGPDLARVFAVDGDGTPRELTILDGPIARAAPGFRRMPAEFGAAPVVLAPSRVSDRGFLAIPVVAAEPTDGSGANGVVVVDLRAPGAKPAFVAGAGGGTVQLGWGPTGLLATETPDGATIYGPEARSVRTVHAPAGVSASSTWAADGSGLIATKPLLGAPGTAHGVLTLDGAFVAEAPRFGPTGFERWPGDGSSFGVAGRTEGTAVTRTLTETVRPGVRGAEEREVEWYSGTETLDRSDPMPLDWQWDASGTGIWLLMRDATEFSIGHLDGPGGTPRVVARFPRLPEDPPITFTGGPQSYDPAFAGFLSNDGIIAVARPRTTQGGLDREMDIWLVDTAGGTAAATIGGELAGWALTTGAVFPGEPGAAPPTP